MSFERGRGGYNRSSTPRQRVTDTPNTRSPRERAAERSRTNPDGTRTANQQNDSSAAAAIANIRARDEANPLRGMPTILSGIGAAMRAQMIKLLEQGGTPVYDPSGRIAIGVMKDGKYFGRDRSTGNQGGGDDERPAQAAGTAPGTPPAAPPADEPAGPPVVRRSKLAQQIEEENRRRRLAGLRRLGSRTLLSGDRFTADTLGVG
tara:strand:- start:361 stop:975 length:615 start_codon:yes stop_codon:yes gene_type:complete